MAFCNSCGTALALGAKFCPKCGAATGATAAAPAATPVATTAAPLPAAPAPTGGSSALKIILIILAIVVGLIIVAAGSCAYFVHRAIHSAHVNNKTGEVSIDTPFGSLNGSSDPAQAAKDTGVDPYPGATMQRGGAANVTFGKIHTATATYDSDDSPSAVADFYRSKFPDAQISQRPDGGASIVSGSKDNLTTITIEPREGKTRIVIAKVTNTGAMTQ